jgi:hypothetical protein
MIRNDPEKSGGTGRLRDAARSWGPGPANASGWPVAGRGLGRSPGQTETGRDLTSRPAFSPLLARHPARAFPSPFPPGGLPSSRATPSRLRAASRRGPRPSPYRARLSGRTSVLNPSFRPSGEHGTAIPRPRAVCRGPASAKALSRAACRRGPPQLKLTASARKCNLKRGPAPSRSSNPAQPAHIPPEPLVFQS